MSSDSDIALSFKALKEFNGDKRARNKDCSTGLLLSLGLNVESKNWGNHLVVSAHSKVWDFWPTTGKFKRRDQVKYYRGVKTLIAHINRLGRES